MEYISLQEATKLCNYSQEYLSLRARRGKLKSMKLGRNWVTTKEWLADYAGKVQEYNESINTITAKAKYFSPPENLPIVRFPNFKLRFGYLRSGFLALLVLASIAASGFFAQESFVKNYNNLSPYVKEAGKRGSAMVLQTYRNIERFSDDFYVATINYRDTAAFASDLFGEYGRWLENQLIK